MKNGGVNHVVVNQQMSQKSHTRVVHMNSFSMETIQNSGRLKLCEYAEGEVVQCQRQDGMWYPAQISKVVPNERGSAMSEYVITPVNQVAGGPKEYKVDMSSLRKEVWSTAVRQSHLVVAGPDDMSWNETEKEQADRNQREARLKKEQKEKQEMLDKGSSLEDLMCTPKILTDLTTLAQPENKTDEEDALDAEDAEDAEARSC